MNVTDRDIENIRRISEQVFGDNDYVEIDEVKDTKGDVMVSVEATDDETLGTRNAFAGTSLRDYHENGYVAVAIGGSDESHSAWFERAEAVEFGSPEPSGTYNLVDDWSAVVRDRMVVKKDDEIVAHIKREGWTLDEYVLYSVLPSKVNQALQDAGFEKGDVRADE